MKFTNAQVKKLLSNPAHFKITTLGFSLLVTRLSAIFAKDHSEMSLINCSNEINAFLTKYQPIMKTDYDILSKTL